MTVASDWIQWKMEGSHQRRDKCHCIPPSLSLPTTAVGAVSVWNGEQWKWWTGPTLLTGRYSHGVAAWRGCLYAVGGLDCTINKLVVGDGAEKKLPL